MSDTMTTQENEKRQRSIYELIKALKPLTPEEGEKLKQRGYASYFNGLRLKYGNDKVLIVKQENGKYLLTVIKEYSQGIQYASFAFHGNMELDRPLLDHGVAGIEMVFSRMPKNAGLVTVESAKTRTLN